MIQGSSNIIIIFQTELPRQFKKREKYLQFGIKETTHKIVLYATQSMMICFPRKRKTQQLLQMVTEVCGMQWTSLYTHVYQLLETHKKRLGLFKNALLVQKHKISDLKYLKYLRQKYHNFSLTHLYQDEMGRGTFPVLTDNDFFVPEQKGNW